MRDPTHLPKTFLIYKTISSSKLTTFDVVKYLPRPANGSLGDGPMCDGSLSDGSIDDGSPNAGNPTASWRRGLRPNQAGTFEDYFVCLMDAYVPRS